MVHILKGMKALCQALLTLPALFCRLKNENLPEVLKEFTCFKEGKVKVKFSGTNFIDYTF